MIHVMVNHLNVIAFPMHNNLVHICTSGIERVTELPFPAASRKLEAQRRKEKSEAHLYMNVQVVMEEYFEGHQGNDLFDIDRCPFRQFRIKKMAKLTEFIEILAESLVRKSLDLQYWFLNFITWLFGQLRLLLYLHNMYNVFFCVSELQCQPTTPLAL